MGILDAGIMRLFTSYGDLPLEGLFFLLVAITMHWVVFEWE